MARRPSPGFVLAALLVLPPALAAQRPVSRGLATGPDPAVRIYNLVGSTRVTGWDRDSVAVTGTMQQPGARLFFGGGRRGVKVGIEGPAPEAETAGGVLEVKVPRRTRLWVKSATADVTVSGLTGDVEVYSVSGNVTVDSSPGTLTAESIDGAIRVSAGTEVTRLRTGAGNVVVNEGGGDLSASSVSGPVAVTLVRAVTSLRIESVSGEVRVKGPVSRGAAFDIETHDAPVTLELPRDQQGLVRATTFGGDVADARKGGKPVPGRGQPAAIRLGGDDPTMTVRSLKGTITVQTFGGQ